MAVRFERAYNDVSTVVHLNNRRGTPMQRTTLTRRFSILALVVFLTVPPAAMAEGQTSKRASEILRSVDDLWRGSSSHAITTMRVKTRHYTRTMRLEGWSKGKEQTLFRVLEPKKERGTVTLKSGNHIYTYLPKTDRKIRLTTGMMMGSWMGSHLTNDDLVKEARLEDDYIARISFEGVRDGQNIIEFTLIPKPEAAVVWGKLILVVLADSTTPLSELFYDEDMQLVRTFSFTDMKLLAGRMRPAVVRVVPVDKPDEFTEFIYEKLELDVEISDHFFSVSNLKRR
ncbi:MAG: outer membrane lipoprotein-sorting protein [Candidatus Polarisedimenticolaceae bacterium]|nr:outer membrane lipoprotein-sorting protein [Candidatus Polarisedimenticolaceae bacterium]